MAHAPRERLERSRKQPVQVRVGLPLTGGKLVAAAKDRKYPALVSANAFAQVYPEGHEYEDYFRGFRRPDPRQYHGLDVALDSAGFVAATVYGDYRWTVSAYLDLVASYPWTWWAAMDYCCEPQISGDRPLRLLRIAGTAHLLAECRAEARRRGLPLPMPVLQGWTADEYKLCAQWLPLVEFPQLIGIGSVCRREVRGVDGILAILETLDAYLPAHVQVHLFGVKSTALAQLAHHPRVASVDSMAWDFHARTLRRVGRDMEFRVSQMQAWMNKQQAIVASAGAGVGIQSFLFDPAEFGGGFSDEEELVLEALSLQFADLLMGGDIEYRDAVHYLKYDGTVAIAILRQRGLKDSTLADFDELVAGLGDRIEDLKNKQDRTTSCPEHTLTVLTGAGATGDPALPDIAQDI